MKKTDSYRKNRHLFIDRTTARCRARRNADFIAVCQRIVDRNAASGIYVPLHMVLCEALSSAAPDYYITYEVALARIYAIAARNGRIGSRPSIRRMQYAEIYSRACRLRETSAFFDTMEKAVAHVLLSGNASAFFISYDTARRIFNSSCRSCGRLCMPRA